MCYMFKTILSVEGLDSQEAISQFPALCTQRDKAGEQKEIAQRTRLEKSKDFGIITRMMYGNRCEELFSL